MRMYSVDMPELPEVEAVRTSLLPHLVGRTVKRAEVLHRKTVRGDKAFEKTLAGKTFVAIRRRGKLLFFDLDDGGVLLGHLKMTGQFFYHGKKVKTGGGHSLSAKVAALPDAHTRVILHLENGDTLYFNDMRLFGYIKIATRAEADAAEATYGIEPGLPDFTLSAFRKALGKRTAPIKGVLLNQALISGLGNIYVDEACFRARVRPMRRTNTLTAKEVEKLYEGAKSVIAEAIALGGTTFRNYSDATGNHGRFREKLQVFDRAGEPCVRCGKKGIVVKTVCAGRGTHYCPKCQK